MDINTLLQLVQNGGVIGLLLIILVGGWKKWWVWGWMHEDLKEEVNEWKQLALKGTRVAEAVARIVESEKGQ